MADIVTLTMNPAIDAWVSVERVQAFQKLRCSAARRDPGGGGINVARVLKRFGADVTAIYPNGGGLGQLLRHLVDQEGLSGLTIPVANETREDFTVFEQSTGSQFRFVLPGPHLSEPEWRACLALLGGLQHGVRFVVGSGSLPPGVPEDFYVRVAQTAKRSGSKVIIDTVGRPLRAALEAGVYLIKPNLNEFRSFMGGPLETEAEWIAACRALVERGQVEIVALTLGEQGALLVTRDRVPARPSPRNNACQRGRRRRQLFGSLDLEPGVRSLPRNGFPKCDGRRISRPSRAGNGAVLAR